jgi:hypothetical protein
MLALFTRMSREILCLCAKFIEFNVQRVLCPNKGTIQGLSQHPDFFALIASLWVFFSFVSPCADDLSISLLHDL